MSRGRSRRPGLSPPGPGACRVTLVVPRELDGERVDRALAALGQDLSRTLARKILAMGGVHVGERRVRVASRRVRAGDVLTATWHPDVLTPERFPLELVHEDGDVVVVVKPPGQLSQGTELGDVGSLVYALAHRFGPEIRLMHRLDRPASGLLVVARHKRASGWLTPQFREHTIERVYDLVTQGAPTEGSCEIPIAREGRRMRPARPGEDGLSARTDVTVRGLEGGRAWVQARLHTGRTHQIRVHMMAMGSPLIGDRMYGGPEATRMCLHARRIGFQHPDGEPRVYERAPGGEFWAAAGFPEPPEEPS